MRAVGLGALAFAEKSPSGEEVYPRLELLRLAIPRRVYTYTHLEYVAEVFGRLAERNGEREAPVLRHFLSRLEPAR